jgi:DNA polymerase
MGEQDLVLDGLPVDELLKVLGAPGANPALVAALGPRPVKEVARPASTVPPPFERPSGPASGSEPPRPAAKTSSGDLGPISVGGALAAAVGPVAGLLESLEAVAAAVAACKACALHSTATNSVPGEGNPQAKFVCVGEAPGATEDATGRPFVGRAGELLTKILEAVKFKREEVFICNVLKHRPPGNRNPAADEIAACSPFLLQQLAILKPHVILALGTFAAQTLLQTTQPIGKLRGQIHRFYGVPLIVTYHPAALLRNSNWKRPTWEDVQLARRIFDNAAGA